MSEVVPRSSPDAAARFSTPSRPSSISEVSHPAIAIYFNASADSEAENLVLLPISSAFALSAAKSSPVAPEIAPTSDILYSKSAAVSMAFFPSRVRGVVIPRLIFAPSLVAFSPTVLKPPESFSEKDWAFSVVALMLWLAASVFIKMEPNNLNISIYITL